MLDDEKKAELLKFLADERAKAIAAMEEKGEHITSQAKAEVIVHAERVVADKIAFYEGMLKVTGLSAAALAAVLGFWGVNQWSGFVDALSKAVVDRVAPTVSSTTSAQLETLRREYLINLLSARRLQGATPELSDSELDILFEALRSPDLSVKEFQQVTELLAAASQWGDAGPARTALRAQAEQERSRWLATPDEDAERRLYAVMRALNDVQGGPLPWWLEIVTATNASDRLRLTAAVGADGARLFSRLTEGERETVIGGLLGMQSPEGRAFATAISPTSKGVQQWVRANCAKGTTQPGVCGASLFGALTSKDGVPLAGVIARGLLDTGVGLNCKGQGGLSLHGNGGIEVEPGILTVNLRKSYASATFDFDHSETWAAVEFLEPALRDGCVSITLDQVPGFEGEAILMSGKQSSNELHLVDEQGRARTIPVSGGFNATVTVTLYQEWNPDTG